MRAHHKPSLPGDALFAGLEDTATSTAVLEAAAQAASLLVRGAHSSADAAVAERVLRLAEEDSGVGLAEVAELWSSAAPDSLAGCLWRLYALRTWVQQDPVTAAADGLVKYSGNGVRGLGNLIIVEHQNGFITAYAHNRAVLVKTGQTVKRGAKIAELGQSDTTSPRLHFEIRRQGQPVDPMQYLPAK